MAFLDRTGPLDGPANGHCELSATLDSFSDDPGTTALVFPPTLNSYERLQIHTLVQNCYSHRLTSFSAGEENQRRILIVPKSALKPSSVTAAALDVPPLPKEAVCQTVPLTENLPTNKAGSKKKRLPSQALYRPRAARLAESAANTSEGQIRSKPLPHPAEALAPKNWKDEVQQKLGDAQIRWVECFSLPSSCGKPLDAAAPLDESSEFELNILEIYGFPVEYKTGDLTKELDPFKNKYELRWVDDTHAVAIFETEALAAKALSHPFPSIKVQFLSEGIAESQSRASSYLRSRVKLPRPATSTLIARRMLTGALGKTLKMTQEEERRELRKLESARDHKKNQPVD